MVGRLSGQSVKIDRLLRPAWCCGSHKL